EALDRAAAVGGRRLVEDRVAERSALPALVLPFLEDLSADRVGAVLGRPVDRAVPEMVEPSASVGCDAFLGGRIAELPGRTADTLVGAAARTRDRHRRAVGREDAAEAEGLHLATGDVVFTGEAVAEPTVHVRHIAEGAGGVALGLVDLDPEGVGELRPQLVQFELPVLPRVGARRPVHDLGG